MSSHAYKTVLGKLLADGFTRNHFGYEAANWPPRTPARLYISDFLNKHRLKATGRMVEFYPASYKQLFPQATHYDVWNVSKGDGVTVVGDLQHAPHVHDETYDAVICTHVLSAIRNVWQATQELHRIMHTGGLLLVTVPCVLQAYAPDPKDYWRFTLDSLAAVLESFTIIDLCAYGNAATVAGVPYYLMTDHFPPEVLAQQDLTCPSIVCAAAVK